MRKMSEVLIEVAMSQFRDESATPSFEAANAALLLAHVAWNSALVPEAPIPKYKTILRAFVKDRPQLWDELSSRNPEKLIGRMQRYKDRHHRDDRRWILVAGIQPGGNVHVEFADEPPPLESLPSPAMVKVS